MGIVGTSNNRHGNMGRNKKREFASFAKMFWDRAATARARIVETHRTQ